MERRRAPIDSGSSFSIESADRHCRESGASTAAPNSRKLEAPPEDLQSPNSILYSTELKIRRISKSRLSLPPKTKKSSKTGAKISSSLRLKASPIGSRRTSRSATLTRPPTSFLKYSPCCQIHLFVIRVLGEEPSSGVAYLLAIAPIIDTEEKVVAINQFWPHFNPKELGPNFKHLVTFIVKAGSPYLFKLVERLFATTRIVARKKSVTERTTIVSTCLLKPS